MVLLFAVFSSKTGLLTFLLNHFIPVTTLLFSRRALIDIVSIYYVYCNSIFSCVRSEIELMADVPMLFPKFSQFKDISFSLILSSPPVHDIYMLT